MKTTCLLFFLEKFIWQFHVTEVAIIDFDSTLLLIAVNHPLGTVLKPFMLTFFYTPKIIY